MTGSTNLLPVNVAAIAVASRVARIEKSHRSNGLHDDGGRGRQNGEQPSHKPQIRNLSHSGTTSAPQWYATRLSSPFVAQILGQVLFSAEPDAGGARAAYDTAPVPAAGSLYDSKF